jgi:hypothetical protein
MCPHLILTNIKSQYRSHVTSELECYLVKTVRDLLLLALIFFIENTMVQVISAVEHDRRPLRDLAYEFIVENQSNQLMMPMFDISIETLVTIWVLYCLSRGTHGLTVIQKGVRCLIVARALRICLFSITVIPSPKAHCRFRGPINPFKMRVGGACNDLLYSGHVTVYTLAGIAFTILSQDYSTKLYRYLLPISVWFYIGQRIIKTIFERHHYSIDMFLGFIVTQLIWQCQPLYIDLPQVPSCLLLHLRQLIFARRECILKQV